MSRHRRRSRRRLARRFLQLAACSLATLSLIAGLEAIAAMLIDKPSDAIVPHLRLNHTWKPNGAWVHREWRHEPAHNQSYVHVYNEQGWLERYDIAVEKPPGTYRIFYVGDSFTEGTVAMEGSVPSLVEVWLNERFANSTTHFEVINTGTTSYSPILYYILVRYYISAYSPDLIVVNVSMGDPDDDWKYRANLVVDQDGNPWAAPRRDIYASVYVDTLGGRIPTSGLAKLKLFLYEHSNLYNLLRLYSPRAPQPEPQLALFAGQEDGWTSKHRDADKQSRSDYSLDVVRRLIEYCRQQGIRVALTGVPRYEQFAYRDGRPVASIEAHQRIRRVTEAAGGVYFDSLSGLMPKLEHSAKGDYYFEYDLHFNPDGYRAWAEVHLQALMDPKLNLLPEAVF